MKLFDFYKLLSGSLLVSGYFTMVLTFFIAYLDPTKGTLVLVDSYGEGFVELVLILFSFPGVCVLVWTGFTGLLDGFERK